MEHLLQKHLLLFSFSLLSIASPAQNKKPVIDTATEIKQVNTMLDAFNKAAAKADFNGYFNFYTDDAIFTGTDATERWDKKGLMAYAKPYFDKGHGWSFTAIERHIYFDKTGTLAWFDELLNTQMKICRGSGVLVKDGNAWKVKQYILSATVPNDQMDQVVKMKTLIEDSVLHSINPDYKSSTTNTTVIDPVKILPGIFKVLLENDHVRVVEYSLKPGEKDDWHTHPPKSSYVVSGGKLKVHLENGETIIADEKAGTASWMDYVGKHYVENIGTTTVTIIYTEIK